MSAVKDKIAKLLALAASPNEKEAQAALLKARELMAKHKLQPEECQKDTASKVVVKTVGVECTTLTDPWAVALGGIIAKRYCCEVFRRRNHGAKNPPWALPAWRTILRFAGGSTCMPTNALRTAAGISGLVNGIGMGPRNSGRCATLTAGASAMGWRRHFRNRSGSIRNGASFWLCPRPWKIL